MIAKFELSAYGVEEMNKQEMIEVEGGVAWGWVFKAVAGSIIGDIITVVARKMLIDPETNTILENQSNLFEQREIRLNGLHVNITKDGLMFALDSLIIKN